MAIHSEIKQLREQLRQQLRKARGELSAAARQAAAQAVCQRMLTPLAGGLSQVRIGVYLAGHGELSLDPFIQTVLQRRGQLFAPVVLEQGEMAFHPLPQLAGLPCNRFSLREPAPGLACPIEQLDLIVAPLLAFDRNGNRLGSGGGYYDRYLATAREPGPLTIGAAFHFQQSTSLPAQSWDIPLHAVVTEKDLIVCNRPRWAQFFEHSHVPK